jgi:hypothetical protein
MSPKSYRSIDVPQLQETLFAEPMMGDRDA